MGDNVKKVDAEGIAEIEEYEHEKTVSDENMAIAETIIANLLVKQWLNRKKNAANIPTTKKRETVA